MQISQAAKSQDDEHTILKPSNWKRNCMHRRLFKNKDVMHIDSIQRARTTNDIHNIRIFSVIN